MNDPFPISREEAALLLKNKSVEQSGFEVDDDHKQGSITLTVLNPLEHRVNDSFQLFRPGDRLQYPATLEEIDELNSCWLEKD